MTTKFVGLKEFRQNLSSFTEEVASGKVRLIVLKKNKPVLKVDAINLKEFSLEALRKDIAEAREEVKRGEVYTMEEIKRMHGI